MSWGDRQSAAFRAVAETLNENQVEWLVLRNHTGLPEANRSKDVDLGLAKSAFPRAEQLIRQALKENGFTHIDVEDFQYVRCLTFFGFFPEGAASIKIDLLDGFVSRGAQLFHFEDIYRNSEVYDNFRVPSRIDDAVMLWCKPLMTGGALKPKYIPDIERALATSELEFYRTVNTLFLRGTAKDVKRAISQNGLVGTEAMQSRLRLSSWARAFAKQPFRTIWNTLLHGWIELMRRARRPNASVFAFYCDDLEKQRAFIETFKVSMADLRVKDESLFVTQRMLLATDDCHGWPKLVDGMTQVMRYWSSIRPQCIRGKVFCLYFSGDPNVEEQNEESMKERCVPVSDDAFKYFKPDYTMRWASEDGFSVGRPNLIFEKSLTVEAAVEQAVQGVIYNLYQEI